MCRSQAEGGQRCFGYAKERYGKAVTTHIAARRAYRAGANDPALDVDEHRALNKALSDAEAARSKAAIELASTEQGQEMLRAEHLRLEEKYPARWAMRASAELRLHMRAGQEMKERNAAVLAESRLTPDERADRDRLAEERAAQEAEEAARNVIAHRIYQSKALSVRSEAARRGHGVAVSPTRASVAAGRPVYKVSCTGCGRLGQSVMKAVADARATAHAGQHIPADLHERFMAEATTRINSTVVSPPALP